MKTIISLPAGVAVFVALALAGMMGIFAFNAAPAAEAQSSDATLSSLTITTADGNPVFLDPRFSPTETEYEATGNNAVERGVQSVTVVAEPADEDATVTISGQSAGGDGATVSVPEPPEQKTFRILVTAADGETTKEYFVTIERRKSNVATLDDLSLTGSDGKAVGFHDGSSPPEDVDFATLTTSYTSTVVFSITSVTVAADATDGNATYKVTAVSDGGDVTVGDDGSLKLAEGSTTITVTVTAEDGTVGGTPYTIAVTRSEASNDGTLKELEFSPGGVPSNTSGTFVGTGDSPNNDAGDYTLTVASNVSRVDVTAVPTNAFAKPVVKGGRLNRLVNAGTNDETDGTTTITVEVTPEDGSTADTYTITVTRQAVKNDNHLRDLSVMDDRHNPWEPKGAEREVDGEMVRDDLPFSPYVAGDSTTDYYTTVGQSVDKVTVMAMTNVTGAKAVVTASGGAASVDEQVVTLSTVADTNTVILVTVTPSMFVDEDGEIINTGVDAVSPGDQQTYRITVAKVADEDTADNADLMDLSLSAGMLTPMFDEDDTEYTAKVLSSVTEVTVTAPAVGKYALVKVNGVQVDADDQATVALDDTGETIVATQVTADDGTQKTYYVTITRGLQSDDAYLSALSLSDGTLMPDFMVDTMAYTAMVENSVESVTVTATASHAEASVSGDGMHDLDVGDTVITVTVTAEDGTTMMPYTITVTRAAPENPILDKFDGDDSGAIERPEMIAAINRYLDDDPPYTRAEIIALINYYLDQ